MFPHQTRSKTQEIQGSNIEEALNGLSYSKSFNVPEANQSGDSSTQKASERVRVNWARTSRPVIVVVVVIVVGWYSKLSVIMTSCQANCVWTGELIVLSTKLYIEPNYSLS